MSKYDVITMGSAVVDVFVDTTASEERGQLCFPIGDKILIKSLKFTSGGGGTNTAVSFSKLGLKVGFIGKLGSGMNAGIVLRELAKEGVKFLGVQGKERTGYSVVLGAGGGRTILTYKGASNELSFGELGKIPRAKWLYCSSMMEKSFRTQERVAKEICKRGAKVAFNPSLYQVKKGKGHLKHILRCSEVLILNRDEAERLVGKNPLKKLRALGPRIVCITNGKKGNQIYDGTTLYDVEVHRSVKCVERTGAGDAFSSGFVAGLVRGRGIEGAIQIGSLNAESVIQKPGAKNGLLSWSGALAAIRRGPVKISKKVC